MLPAVIDGVEDVTKPLEVDDLKHSLFVRTKERYRKFEGIAKKSEFTEDSVDVTIKNNQVEASVCCTFCTSTDENRTVKVFCRTIDGLKSTWVLSNLNRHEIRHHQLGDKPNIRSVPKNGSISTKVK